MLIISGQDAVAPINDESITRYPCLPIQGLAVFKAEGGNFVCRTYYYLGTFLSLSWLMVSRAISLAQLTIKMFIICLGSHMGHGSDNQLVWTGYLPISEAIKHLLWGRY